LALYKGLQTNADRQDFYNKYLKDTAFDWANMEERHAASSSRDNMAVDGVDVKVPGGSP